VLEIGAARVDITVYEDDQPMFGWVYPENIARGVAKPLHARAFVLREPQHNVRVALVLIDWGYVSQAVRQAVLDRLATEHPTLGLGEPSLLLTATHTHSAPGGLSHYLFYCAAASGFSQPVFDTVVDGIIRAIVEADRRRRPGRVSMGRGDIPLEERVAFNRNITGYNANRDVSPKVKGKRSPEAVEREMCLLRFDDEQGRPIGAWSWFGVHGTCVHRDNQLLHPDHKGCAAEQLEQRMAAADHPDFVAAFAQGPSGDVTPNFRRDRSRGMMVGELDDDFASADFVGEIQARQAAALLDRAAQAEPLAPELDADLLYADLGDIEVAPSFSDGLVGLRSVPSEIGLRMILGTEEGPGASPMLGPLVEGASRLRLGLQRLAARFQAPAPAALEGRRVRQGPKICLIDTGRGPHARLFGFHPATRRLPLPGSVHPVIAFIKRAQVRDTIDEHPLTPRILPTQVLVIGRLAIAAVPAEPTTVVGRRLRASLGAALAERGVDHVVITSYANAYAGYVTTPEEYDLQSYEGASTHFGRWTLGAYQTLFDRLARRLLLPRERRPADHGPRPPRFDPAVIAARAYQP